MIGTEPLGTLRIFNDRRKGVNQGKRNAMRSGLRVAALAAETRWKSVHVPDVPVDVRFNMSGAFRNGRGQPVQRSPAPVKPMVAKWST